VGEKALGATDRVADDGPSAPGAVGNPRRVPEVDQVFLRKGAPNGTGHGEPTQTRIEDADRFSHARSVRQGPTNRKQAALRGLWYPADEGMPELLLITTDALLHDRVEEVLQDTDWSVHWERSEHIPAVLPDESFIVVDSAHPEASTWNAPATRSLLLVADHPDRVRGMLSVYHDFILSPIDAAEFRQRLQRMRLRPPDGPSYEYADMFA